MKNTTQIPLALFALAIIALDVGCATRPTSDAKSIGSKESLAPVRIGRRVITGVDAQGRSRIDSDQQSPEYAAWKEPRGAEGMDFWIIRKLPTPLAGAFEPTVEWKRGNRAPSGGAIGRLITWPPGFEFPIHTTRTLDFGIILSGRLELILDTGSTILNPGDVIIQRGTAHGWRVVGSEACTWAVVLLDASPEA